VGEVPSVTGSKGNVVIDEVVTKVGRFRDKHLSADTDVGLGSRIGRALRQLGPDLAQMITADEDTAGLFDRAFGEWLIQPTVFDMLEYRFQADLGAHVAAAFQKLRRSSERVPELDLLERVFHRRGRPLSAGAARIQRLGLPELESRSPNRSAVPRHAQACEPGP